jgi:hypothetical protein
LADGSQLRNRRRRSRRSRVHGRALRGHRMSVPGRSTISFSNTFAISACPAADGWMKSRYGETPWSRTRLETRAGVARLRCGGLDHLLDDVVADHRLPSSSVRSKCWVTITRAPDSRAV